MNPERMQPPSFDVFPATADDLRPLVDVEEAVSMQRYPNPELGITPEDIAAIGWGEERATKYRERFLKNPDANVWVAKQDGEVVGFAAATRAQDGNWIRKLYVASEYQNHGIGSRLLQQAESWLGQDKDIQLGIASYDTTALQFYIERGYAPVELRPDEQTTIHSTGKVIHETLLVKH
jgi:GNAT superfamily N-acetyltransferase